MIEIPLTPVQVMTLPIAVIGAGLIALWLKQYIPDKRIIPALVLALTIAVECVAACLSSGSYWMAIALGFVAASIEVFGYEAVANLAGMAGIGHRA